MLMPYAVNVEHLRTPHAFTADPAEFLAWLEDLYCTGDELAPTPQSMRRLFYAEDLSDVDGDQGAVYGYTLEALCMRFGALLDSDQWASMRFGWFDRVQEELTRAGGRFDLLGLVFSGPPVSLPPIDDFPGIGHVPRAAMPQRAEELRAADLSTIDDPQVVAAIRQVSGWLDWCMSAEDDFDLVTFYS
ncbi:DUF7691 family protein [Actinomadura fibrosa]